MACALAAWTAAPAAAADLGSVTEQVSQAQDSVSAAAEGPSAAREVGDAVRDIAASAPDAPKDEPHAPTGAASSDDAAPKAEARAQAEAGSALELTPRAESPDAVATPSPDVAVPTPDVEAPLPDSRETAAPLGSLEAPELEAPVAPDAPLPEQLGALEETPLPDGPPSIEEVAPTPPQLPNDVPEPPRVDGSLPLQPSIPALPLDLTQDAPPPPPVTLPSATPPDLDSAIPAVDDALQPIRTALQPALERDPALGIEPISPELPGIGTIEDLIGPGPITLPTEPVERITSIVTDLVSSPPLPPTGTGPILLPTTEPVERITSIVTDLGSSLPLPPTGTGPILPLDPVLDAAFDLASGPVNSWPQEPSALIPSTQTLLTGLPIVGNLHLPLQDGGAGAESIILPPLLPADPSRAQEDWLPILRREAEPGPADAGTGDPPAASPTTPRPVVSPGTMPATGLNEPAGTSAGAGVSPAHQGVGPAGETAPLAAAYDLYRSLTGMPDAQTQDGVRAPPSAPPSVPSAPESPGSAGSASAASGMGAAGVNALLLALLGLAAGLIGRLLIAPERWRPLFLVAQLQRPG